MNKAELKKIEMKNDGKDFERFQELARKVVNVSKKDIQTQEKKTQAKKDKR